MVSKKRDLTARGLDFEEVSATRRRLLQFGINPDDTSNPVAGKEDKGSDNGAAPSQGGERPGHGAPVVVLEDDEEEDLSALLLDEDDYGLAEPDDNQHQPDPPTSPIIATSHFIAAEIEEENGDFTPILSGPHTQEIPAILVPATPPNPIHRTHEGKESLHGDLRESSALPDEVLWVANTGSDVTSFRAARESGQCIAPPGVNATVPSLTGPAIPTTTEGGSIPTSLRPSYTGPALGYHSELYVEPEPDTEPDEDNCVVMITLFKCGHRGMTDLLHRKDCEEATDLSGTDESVGGGEGGKEELPGKEVAVPGTGRKKLAVIKCESTVRKIILDHGNCPRCVRNGMENLTVSQIIAKWQGERPLRQRGCRIEE